jgi:hypothetical protein
MPAYPIGIGKVDYQILEKEAQRKKCSTRDLIKEAFNRNIDGLRGGVTKRRRQ